MLTLSLKYFSDAPVAIVPPASSTETSAARVCLAVPAAGAAGAVRMPAASSPMTPAAAETTVRLDKVIEDSRNRENGPSKATGRPHRHASSAVRGTFGARVRNWEDAGPVAAGEF